MASPTNVQNGIGSDYNVAREVYNTTLFIYVITLNYVTEHEIKSPINKIITIYLKCYSAIKHASF